MPGRLCRADLHLHSTFSDGKLTPEELVAQVAAQNLQVMALSDHENLAGLSRAQAAAERSGLVFIPGVEISTEGEDELHILLYFVHEGMNGLTGVLREINEEKEARCPRFVDCFKKHGIFLSVEDFQIPEGTYCNRVLVAETLVRLGHVSSIEEAFDRWLAVGRPCYIGRKHRPAADVIRLALEEGAVPVLAHPDTIRRPVKKSFEAIQALRDAGLKGIEVYHSKHSDAACHAWAQVARELGLLVTGGSDFHRLDDPKAYVGNQVGRWLSACDDVAALLEAGGVNR